MWIIEDKLHAELQDGEFHTRHDAIAELKRRANLPWDAAPNLAPCTVWQTCGRHYKLIERDGSKEKSRESALDVSESGVIWHLSN